MEDVGVDIIANVEKEFDRLLQDSEKIRTMYAMVRDGTATYANANDFSVEVGNLLSKAFQSQISSDVLPNGRMYYNIAERLMNKMLRKDHDIISEVTADVQTIINDAAGYGVNGIVASVDEKRIQGFIERLSEELDYDSIKWILGEPITIYSLSVLTDTMLANAKVMDDLGVNVTITRLLGRGESACKWCKSLAGVYNYESVSNSGNEIYMRHDRCRCQLLPSNGKMKVSGHAFVRA